MRHSTSFREPIEGADRSVLEEYQLRQLNGELRRATANSEFYRSRIDVDHLDSLDEITRIPLTTKEEIRHHEGRPTVVCSPDRVVEYHTSSGTTAEPFIMSMTSMDLEMTRRILARTWWMHGVRYGDVVQNMAAYGPFTAGLLNHYALQQLGANVFPSGVQSSVDQIEYANRIDADYLVAVSSYYPRLIEVRDQEGLKLPDLKGVVGGGVPVSESMREYVSEELDAPFYNQYGLAEINTGIAGECRCREGLHLQADYVYPEVVDPETHEPVAEGEKGVLVLTTLGRDAQVMLRYLTGDVTAITYEECDCGRTLPRLAPISGRTDDVLFVRGTKLEMKYLQSFAESLDDVIDPFNWQLRVDRKAGRDALYFYARWRNGRPAPDVLTESFESRIGLALDGVRSVEELESDDGVGKLRRVRDERR